MTHHCDPRSSASQGAQPGDFWSCSCGNVFVADEPPGGEGSALHWRKILGQEKS